MYILTRVNLLYTVRYEIPCSRVLHRKLLKAWLGITIGNTFEIYGHMHITYHNHWHKHHILKNTIPQSDMQKWLTGSKTKTDIAIRKLWLVPQVSSLFDKCSTLLKTQSQPNHEVIFSFKYQKFRVRVNHTIKHNGTK